MADWPAKKNEAFELQFPIYDADGDLVTAAASLDTEVSQDGGTFADATNEATEIATGSGCYKVTLTAAEMNVDRVMTITKTGTAGAKTAVNLMYTVARKLSDLAFPATSGRSIQVEADGMVHADLKEWLGAAPNALVSSRVDVSVGAMAADVVTAAAIAANAIGSSELATDAIGDAQIATGAIAATAFAAGAIDAAAIANGAIDAATFAAGAIDAAAIATDAIDADALASDAITEIRSLVTGTADAGGSSTTMVDAARTEADDVFIGAWILFTSGAVANQVRLITEFVAATDTITFAPAATASIGAGITYEILPNGAVDLQSWLGLVTGLVAPNALVTGAVDVDVSAIQANVITAAAIANAAIDAATFAAGAIDAAAIANGAIDAATFAAGAIDAAAIATDAIDADALSADAGTELADALLLRNVSNTEAAAGFFTLTSAILKGTSRVRDNAGTLEVFETDGLTVHMSHVITVNASADPIDELGAPS